MTKRSFSDSMDHLFINDEPLGKSPRFDGEAMELFSKTIQDHEKAKSAAKFEIPEEFLTRGTTGSPFFLSQGPRSYAASWWMDSKAWEPLLNRIIDFIKDQKCYLNIQQMSRVINELGQEVVKPANFSKRLALLPSEFKSLGDSYMDIIADFNETKRKDEEKQARKTEYESKMKEIQSSLFHLHK